MHKLKGEYGDYYGNRGCYVKVEGGEPYLLLNMEMFHKMKGLSGSHCDFTYITFKDEEFHIFIVELKNVERSSDESLEEILNKSVEKLRNSLEIIDEFAKQSLNIRNTRTKKYYAILALPQHVIDRVKPLLSHFKMKYRSLIKIGYKDVWITSCGLKIWDKVVPLKK
ncbi:MAG: hypothetical protein ACTSXX_10370 [Candidatus Baldrarchaeia archaeon]